MEVSQDTNQAVSALGDIMEKGIAGFSVHKLLSAVIAAAVALLVIKLLLRVTDRTLGRSHMEPAVKKLVRGGVRALSIAVAVIMVLGCLGIEATSLVAVLSVAGLALSLALQNFLSNVAGGFQILASHPFKPGDWVEAGGCSGTVAEIGMFYTKLNSVDNKLIQLPNSVVVSGTIVNHTAEALRWVELKLTASYNSDPALVIETLTRMAEEHPLTMDDPKPFVHVFAYQESDIQYIVRVWCRNQDYWTVYYDLMDALKPGFDKAGIEFTYPHLNVHTV